MGGYVLRRLEPHADEILARYTAGATFDEIATDHGCAWGTIRRFLLSRGVTLRRPERPLPSSRSGPASSMPGHLAT